jgi:hypothetical protein
MSALGVPRRQLLQGAGAVGLAALLQPTAAFGEFEEEDERPHRRLEKGADMIRRAARATQPEFRAKAA